MAVEKALRRALALWVRLNPQEYPNGVVVFSSENVTEAVHPLQPLHRRVYSCGSTFDTILLRKQIDIEKAPTYGIIVIDGSDALIGTANGLGMSASQSSVTRLAHVQSNTASSTRRGGQSALRYSRLRESEDLAFRRRVAARAAELFVDLRAIVIGGKADTKRRLLPELSQNLRAKILCVVDLACAANCKQSLCNAALRAGDAARLERKSTANDVLRVFLETLDKPACDTGMLCCYGESQTAIAVGLGAVDALLLAKDHANRCITRPPIDWVAIARDYGTTVHFIEASHEQGNHFCNAYVVGGLLRWPIESDLLEDAEEHEEDVATDVSGDVVTADARSCEQELSGITSSCARIADTVDSPRAPREDRILHCEATMNESLAHDAPQLYDLVFPWLGSVLNDVCDDSTTAEALCMCVEVILQDDSSDRNAVVMEAASMLLGEGVSADIVDEMVARAI